MFARHISWRANQAPWNITGCPWRGASVCIRAVPAEAVGGDKVSELSASSLIGSFSYFRAALPFQPRSRSADRFWRFSPLDLEGLTTGSCVSKASKGADPTPNSDQDLRSPKGKSIELPQLGLVLAMLEDGVFPSEPGWPPLREPVCRPSYSLALTETRLPSSYFSTPGYLSWAAE